MAFSKLRDSFTFSHIRPGKWDRSAVFIYKYKIPFSSRTVAYWLLANGHDAREHKPVKLYSWRQKFCVSVLEYGQCRCFICYHYNQLELLTWLYENKTICWLCSKQPAHGEYFEVILWFYIVNNRIKSCYLRRRVAFCGWFLFNFSLWCGNKSNSAMKFLLHFSEIDTRSVCVFKVMLFFFDSPTNHN